MSDAPRLPIDDVLSEISSQLERVGRLVIAAPPGAGKTTRVPLHLLDHPATNDGRILLLEPRRLAARGAAARMAETLGESVGETVGLVTRLERRVSDRTRIEVITDGLFTRRILRQPDLDGIAMVIFDEIHERSLNIDLGLALACEVQEALRGDTLKLIAMSATLDTARISGRLGAALVESEGRSFPVETRYVGKPDGRLEDHAANIIRQTLSAHDGSLLVFLPGAGDIRRVEERLLEGRLPPGAKVLPLYGGLSPAAQDEAIRPAAPDQRKIVLSTDIAESALTIDGVTIVVDAGLARIPQTDPGGRRTRLVTQRASLASVDQRRGRAGRTAPGICYRLWDEAETRGLPRDIAPEILNTDLSGLTLSLADWGERDASRLTWLDLPPPGRLDAARARLVALGALGEDGALTPLGREMAKLPLAPPLAALIVSAPTPETRALGAEIAALLSERGMGGASSDLAERLLRFRAERSTRATALRRQAERWGKSAKPAGDPGRRLAEAWPDAIARKRPGQAASARAVSYLTAGGEAVEVAAEDPLAKHDWLVVAEAQGSARGARITLAAAIDAGLAEACLPPVTRETARFDPATGTFSARRIRAMGAITLSEQPLPQPSGETARLSILDAIKEHGWSAIGLKDAVDTLLARVSAARAARPDSFAGVETGTLAATAGDWLLPVGSGRKLPSANEFRSAFQALIGWDVAQALERLAPEHVSLPSGRRASIDWLDEKAPLVEARVQEVYGASSHPTLDSRQKITFSLLSPAGRPVAITADLPGFWTGGYRDMAKDMRAQYPKHDWPDDPSSAKPHEGRTKARLKRD